MADGGLAVLAVQPAGDLLRRPAATEAIEDDIAQVLVALQTTAGPPSGPCPLLGVAGFIADLDATIALQLARDGRCRAIQSCRDFAERLPVFMKTGNRAALFEREVFVTFAHDNTFDRCCTSFVNLGGPLIDVAKGPSLRSG
jgi:hypothetical protein